MVIRARCNWLFVLALAAAIAGCEPDKSSIPDDLKAGDQLIAALERYHAAHAGFPDTLSTLIPQYISSIPKPRYGKREWEYRTYKEGTFGLFLSGSQPYHDGYMYASDRGKWEEVHNSF